jgi:hypothetical protein
MPARPFPLAFVDQLDYLTACQLAGQPRFTNAERR